MADVRPGFPPPPSLCPADEDRYYENEDPEELVHPECRAAALHSADQLLAYCNEEPV